MVMKKKLLSLVKELKLEKEVIFLNNIDQKLKISLIQSSKSIFNAIYQIQKICRRIWNIFY